MALVLLLLLVSSFTVFAEEVETLPSTDPHPHSPTPAPHHSPTKSPTHPPVNAPHPHHRYPHHHHHSPAPAPTTVHPPSPSPSIHHPYPTTPVPTKPPTHPHYPPKPAPARPPTPHHHYPPVLAKPPTHQHYPPTPAPSVHPGAPVHPFPRSFVAVQGVVYVKSCKYAGAETLLGATPLLGAVVKLQCNNTKHELVQTGKTDKNGYFYIEAPKSITSYGAHKCNVVLVTAPNALKPSNLHGGVTGAVLRPEKPFLYQKLPFLLYNVGPLAFEPHCH